MGYGEDAMDASEQGLQHLAESLLSEGTTSFSNNNDTVNSQY